MNGCEHTQDAPIVARRFYSRDRHEDVLDVIDISSLVLRRRHKRDLSPLDQIFLGHQWDLLDNTS
jgi:hypothetical protein